MGLAQCVGLMGKISENAPPTSPLTKKIPNPLFYHLLCPVTPKPLLASWFRSTFSSEKSISTIKFDGAMQIIALEWRKLKFFKCLVVLQRKHNCYWIINYSFLISTSVFPSCSSAFFKLFYYFILDLTWLDFEKYNSPLQCAWLRGLHDWWKVVLLDVIASADCSSQSSPDWSSDEAHHSFRALYLKPNCVWIPRSLLWHLWLVFPIYSPVVSSQHCLYTLQISIHTRRDLTTNG